MFLAKYSISDQTHKLEYPSECSRTSYRPAIHNNPDCPRFAATKPRLQRRQGYENSRRHINHTHQRRSFAHDSSQSIDLSRVEKPHTQWMELCWTQHRGYSKHARSRPFRSQWITSRLKTDAGYFPYFHVSPLVKNQNNTKTYFYSMTLLRYDIASMIHNLLCWCCEW